MRRAVALLLFVLGLALWATESDIAELIIKQDRILLGRYSEGHFAALFVLTLLLWGLAAALWSAVSLRSALGNFVLAAASTLVALLVVVYLSSFIGGPARYVEHAADNEKDGESVQAAGILRHRPPNEVYELVYSDEPATARSYPGRPAGYGDVPIVLTSDRNGFRNTSVLDSYDIVAVGDSFVAGSHVSDGQVWTELLSNSISRSIYNLGVSGSGPRTYYNNFNHYALDLKPRIALVMLYAGNDFKPEVAVPLADNVKTVADEAAPVPQASRWEKLDEHLSNAYKRSPVKAGLRRFSSAVLQPINADRRVPGYEEKLGFMPVRVETAGSVAHYSFKPRRLLYLNQDSDGFAASAAWHSTRSILEAFISLCEENGIVPVFLYAPSKPRVVMPLIEDRVPAHQLWNFASYKSRSLPEPEVFKQQLYERLNGQNEVFMQWCGDAGQHCLDLTPALIRATGAGKQTYYSYDQHWTPEGNQVVAGEVERYLAPLMSGNQAR